MRSCSGSEDSARPSVTRGATDGGATSRFESSTSGSAHLATGHTSPGSSCGCSSKRRSTAGPPKQPESDVPDVLATDLSVVFCGINPGRVSAASRAHFANPRNDFWRLLHAAGFTPRLLDPSEQLELLTLGIGITNAAIRTTPGSSDLRRADFAGSAERLEGIARDLRPGAIGFVGKEAYRGAFRERPQLGLQARRLAETALFVLPSTSPANAAVPYSERLRWFKAFRELLS